MWPPRSRLLSDCCGAATLMADGWRSSSFLLGASVCLPNAFPTRERLGCRVAGVGGTPSTPPSPAPASTSGQPGLGLGRWGQGELGLEGWGGHGRGWSPRSSLGEQCALPAGPRRNQSVDLGSSVPGASSQRWGLLRAGLGRGRRALPQSSQQSAVGSGLGPGCAPEDPGLDFRAQEAGAGGAAGPRRGRRRPPEGAVDGGHTYQPPQRQQLGSARSR